MKTVGGAAAVFLGLLAASCGYATLRPHPAAGLKTIAVPQASNETAEPSLGFLLAAELRKCIAASGEPGLVSTSDETAPELLVRIVEARSSPASYRLDGSDRVAAGDNALSVKVEARVRTRDGKDVWGPAMFETRASWVERESSLEALSSEDRGVNRAAADLSRQICDAVTGR